MKKANERKKFKAGFVQTLCHQRRDHFSVFQFSDRGLHN